MDFGKLTEYLDSLVNMGIPSVDLIVRKNHRLLYRHMAGYRDYEKKVPLRGDEVYRLYSCSKVFTTCAVMQLVEGGQIGLDDPVAEYLPAFARLTVKDGDAVRPARRPLLVRHLMSMQSGLDYNMDTPEVNQLLKDTRNQAGTRALMEAKAADPLCFDPGASFQYSLSHDVLAALVEAVTGQRFSEYLREHIWSPLGLTTVTFSPDEALKARFCAQYRYRKDDGSFTPQPIVPDDTPNYESGGGGLFGCAEDYSLFVDALSCGGKTADGFSILSPQMIQLWSANQLCPKGREVFDSWRRLGYSYALGVRTRVDTSVGGLGPVGEFGWDGAACAWNMVDPHGHVSAFFAMHVLDYSFPFEVVHPTIRHMIYEALG